MLGAPMMQDKAPSHARQIGKVVVLASLFGLACITVWALSQGAQVTEDPATSMAIAPMQSMQATRAQSFMRPPQAVPRSNDIARISNAQSEELMTKRQMMAGLAASAGAALPFAANAGVEPVPKNLKNFDGKGPVGLLVFPVATALGWVGFNIIGPAGKQIEQAKLEPDIRGNKKR